MLKNKKVNLTVAIALTAAIAVFDYSMPLGLSIGALYISCIMLLFGQHISVIIGFGVICTVLTLLKAIIFFDPEIPGFYYGGRAIALIAIWLSVLAIRNYQRLNQRLNNTIMLLQKRNKEMEQFVYIASHDLQEPLRSVLSFTEAIEEDYHNTISPEAGEYINYMKKGITRMQDLVKALLDYSRIGRELTKEKVDCNEVVGEVLQDMAASIASTSALIHAQNLPVVNAYKVELKLVFQNLISNAIKFTMHDIPPHVEITVRSVFGFWEFCVADNGIGIDPKHHEKIFIIFKKLHNHSLYEGTGIGLAHCKKIVELHGGTIRVVSSPGKGASFYFTIPKR